MLACCAVWRSRPERPLLLDLMGHMMGGCRMGTVGVGAAVRFMFNAADLRWGSLWEAFLGMSNETALLRQIKGNSHSL